MRALGSRCWIYVSILYLIPSIWSCSTQPSPQTTLSVPSASVLTEAQISATTATSAYEAVERLRPRFLRGVSGPAFEPTVYIDGQRLGGVAELRRIPAMSVAEIRFLTSLEATAIYGTQGHSGAAICVTSKHGG